MSVNGRRDSDPIAVDILHQCDNFVAVDKPYDVLINSNDADAYTLESILVKM